MTLGSHSRIKYNNYRELTQPTELNSDDNE